MIKTKRKIFCIMFALLMCFTCFQTTTVHAAFPMYSTGNTIDLNNSCYRWAKPVDGRRSYAIKCYPYNLNGVGDIILEIQNWDYASMEIDLYDTTGGQWLGTTYVSSSEHDKTVNWSNLVVGHVYSIEFWVTSDPSIADICGKIE